MKLSSIWKIIICVEYLSRKAIIGYKTSGYDQ